MNRADDRSYPRPRPPRRWLALITGCALVACTSDPATLPSTVAAPVGDAGASTAEVTGSVSGLEGGGLILSLAGAGELAVTKNGAFSFDPALPIGTKVHVTVAQQPSKPTQLCTIADGAGELGSSSPSVSVTCVTSAYQVKGTLSGLAGGVVTLANKGGDAITVSANGAFVFPTRIASGQAFDVSVKSQPTEPAQTCHVTGGSGTIASADVGTVVVNCAVDKFSIGGTVSGLAGTLSVANGSSAPLVLTANGNFAFPVTVDSGQPYDVSIVAQPTDPHQTCTLVNARGTVAGLDVVNVNIACTTNRYAVGGTVSGLTTGPDATTLVLHDAAGGTVDVAADGSFVLPQLIDSNAPYAITVVSSPTHPWQTCDVRSGSGIVRGAPITDVAVTCAVDRFPVTATVSGLSGSGLVLRDVAGALVPVSDNGPVLFATTASGDAYAVTVDSQPTSPTQTCSVSAGAGVVSGGAVTSIAVNCATDYFTVGGTVAGLDGQVTITNSGVDLALTSTGAFALPTALASGEHYAITVKTNPTRPQQICTVSNGSGTVGAANIDDVSISCVTSRFAITGTVSGLLGAPLSLGLGNDVVVIAADGPFAFPTTIASGQAYAASVLAQPTAPWQTCTFAHGSGTVTSGDVTDLALTCTTNRYGLGGSVSGLLGSGLALGGGALSTTLNGDGGFQFPTTLASGETFDIAITAQPTNPSQTCSLSGNTGTIGGADVSSIAVNCTTNMYAVTGTVTGLQGSVVITNAGGDAQTLSANGAFAFATPVPSNGTYLVAVDTQPTFPIDQLCTVSNGSGTVDAADITNVSISCSTLSFMVGGSVAGLGAGEQVSLTLNAGAQSLTVSTNDVFAFPTALVSGSSYDVTVTGGPANKQCTVTSGSGTVRASDITGVSVTCAARSFLVGSGPLWTTRPTVYSCVEACAVVFGGAPASYSCSVVPDSITHTAWLSGYGSGAHCAGATAMPETFKVGTTYGPSAYSAYVRDWCATSRNYCFVN